VNLGFALTARLPPFASNAGDGRLQVGIPPAEFETNKGGPLAAFFSQPHQIPNRYSSQDFVWFAGWLHKKRKNVKDNRKKKSKNEYK